MTKDGKQNEMTITLIEILNSQINKNLANKLRKVYSSDNNLVSFKRKRKILKVLQSPKLKQ